MTDDTDPITLADACRNHPSITPAVLLAEAERGNLVVFKLGRRWHTTPGDFKHMVERCRESRRVRASISTASADNGSSAMVDPSSARAALQATIAAVKKPSPTTSRPSTGRARHPNH